MKFNFKFQLTFLGSCKNRAFSQQCFYCGLLSLFVCFLLVCDYLLILFGIVMGISWERADLFAFHVCCFTLCRIISLCSFLEWFMGKDVEFDCIGF